MSEALMRAVEDLGGEDQPGANPETTYYGIVQTLTCWSDADKKLYSLVKVDSRTFRSDEAGVIEAMGDHIWTVGDKDVVCCTTVLRELSMSGPGRIVEAWHYPLGRGEE